MKKIRIGIICPSEIAFRRFMPALKKCDDFEYVGVAVADKREWGGTLTAEMRGNEIKKAENFSDNYGGKIFKNYAELIESDETDAVYLPLPPALHYEWGKKALENGKHLFLEKPSTTSENDTKELVKTANETGLALHENYMFRFHSQLDEINNIVSVGELGEVRLYRIAFGFPKRASNDFRYNKELGGGALLDCGGYTIKLGCILLGETAKIVTSKLNYADAEVDMYGSATMVNDDGVTAQIAFGMDNAYKCELEIWGSKATLYTGRILTAPEGYEPTVTIKSNDGLKEIKLKSDDSFRKSIEFFRKCVTNDNIRIQSYKDVLRQSELVEKIKRGVPDEKN